jgi:MHS family proline/betaine transporter-like MFS transporter
MPKTSIEKHGMFIEVMGNVLEWYSFALFMPFLPILSKVFFPIEDTAYRSVLSFLAFSVGLFMRPFGAMILGPIGDKFGRRRAISSAILLMAIPTVIIGILPDYSQIGIWAPILLVLMRALQGISLGGEYTTAMVHFVEQAPANRRAFFGSLSDAGSQVGVLLGSQTLVFFLWWFGEDEVRKFAWRIPFCFAAILIPLACFVPKTLSTSKEKSEPSIYRRLLKYKKEIWYTAAITSFSAVAFYTLLTFIPYYLDNRHVLSLKEITTCSSYATMIMVVFILLGGILADIYKKKLFMFIGIIGVSVVVYVMFLWEVASYEQWMALQLLYGAFIGLYYSSRAAFFTSVFPPQLRCTAVSVSLSVSQAIFGGLTPVVMDHITKNSSILSVIPATVVAISAIWALLMMQSQSEK